MRHVDPYLPSESLGLSDADRKILIDVARDLEADIIYPWGMGSWSSCICGHMAQRGSKMTTHSELYGHAIYRLFVPGTASQAAITQRQAARACYNFLTTGEPHWDEVCKAAA